MLKTEQTAAWMNTGLAAKERALLLLQAMSVGEKMAQVQGLLWTPQMTDKDIQSAFPNGLGQVSTLFFRAFTSPEQASQTQRAIQRAVMEASPHHIPAVFHMEGVCGPLLNGGVSLPSGIGRGCSFDPALERTLGASVSRQESAVGITQVLAPVLDIIKDPRLGRTGEPYSEDPTLTGVLGSAFTEGIQQTWPDGRTPQACAKHFAAFHLSEGGIHGTKVEVGERSLREIYTKGFAMAIRGANLGAVMPCYCIVGGKPVHVSGALLTKLLRGELGFAGQVLADYSAIRNVYAVQGLYDSMEDAGYAAMAAGVDCELPNKECWNDALEARFADGTADTAVLDRAALRVLTAKFGMGLFEHPFSLEGQALHAAYAIRPEENEAMLRSARESIVLLKNEGVLPLKKQLRKIALIGPQAVTARSFFGGYTHLTMEEGLLASIQTMAGVAHDGASREPVRCIPGTCIQDSETDAFEAVMQRQKPGIHTLLDELKARLPGTEIRWAYGYPIAGGDTSRFDEAICAAKEADLVLLCLGGKHGTSMIASMGEGIDATEIGLPSCQEALLERLAALHKPMVGLHLNGRPISSDIADRVLAAIVECWSPAERGAEAIVDVLTGKVNPSGKLSVSVARNAGQLPVYYNHPHGCAWHQSGSIGFQEYVDCPHTPRYPFGFGLSYTRFAYTELVVSRESAAARDVIDVSCCVENSGSIAGTEIVQLYFEDTAASMARPVRELAGFARAELAPGQKKKITFSFSPMQSAFLDEEMEWRAEAGKLRLMIGSSSEEILLEKTITVTDTAVLDEAARVFVSGEKIDEA